MADKKKEDKEDKNTQEPGIVLKSKKPVPDAEEWLAYAREEERKAPERLEEAARFLSTIISIALTIFLAVTKVEPTQTLAPSVKIALVCWLLSLLAVFLVLFPFRYHCAGNSVQSIKHMQARIVKVKWVLLLSSASLFFAAVCLLAFRLF